VRQRYCNLVLTPVFAPRFEASLKLVGGKDVGSEVMALLRLLPRVHTAVAEQGEHMTIRKGWRGRFFEDFEVGDVYEHPLGRTVTETDNIWFTLLTQNTAPIHFDSNYAAQTEFKKPLVDSTFTVALVTGQSVTDVSQNVMANLGWDQIRLPNPVFEGDTIYSQSEVLEKRESRSRENVGIVTVKTTGYNQDGKVVITFERTTMVYRRGHAPKVARLTPGEER
jgi:itaconyl-CoA hydratase